MSVRPETIESRPAASPSPPSEPGPRARLRLRFWSAVAALLLPSGAHAAAGPDLAWSFFRMFCPLILVVGIILILCYLANRFLKLPGGNPAARYIRIVETRHLAPKKALLLVEVGGEYFLLSNSGDAVSLIKQVDLVEEIEVVEENNYAGLVPAALLEKLKQAAASPSGALGFCLQKKSGGIA